MKNITENIQPLLLLYWTPLVQILAKIQYTVPLGTVLTRYWHAMCKNYWKDIFWKIYHNHQSQNTLDEISLFKQKRKPIPTDL